MIYLTALGLFVWLLGYANERTGLRQHNYKNYLIIAGSAVALMMGLRTRYTGSSDTYSYAGFFEALQIYDTFDSYNSALDRNTEFIFSETGFALFMWLLSGISSDGQFLIFVTSVIITYSTCRFIYKNTQDVPTALLIYVCLGLFTFNMSGMRQALAMSICLWAYEFVKKRKLIPFVLTVLLAMQFHKTAICFLPVYLLPFLKEGKGNVFIYFCGMTVFMFAMEWFIETFNAFTGEDYALDDSASGGGVTVIAIYSVAILLALFKYECLKDREVRCAFFCVVAGFAAYISRFFSNQILERISYYYFYFIMLLIPAVFDRLDEKERQIVRLGFGFLAVVLFWYRTRSGAFVYFRPFFM